MSFKVRQIIRQHRQRTAWVIGIVSLTALVGCGSASVGTVENELAAQDRQVTTASESAAPVAASDRGGPAIPTRDFQSTTRLVKQASLQIELDDIETAIDDISQVLAQNQGDLLQLSDWETESGRPRQVSVQMRVPQNNLEPTLDALRSLGTVTSQSITAEDVANQLVDLQARIRNLRQSEVALLEIMERSGSIADVLEVSRELSTVRESIERNDAQLQSLQNRVAYSTIAITLISRDVTAPTPDPVGNTLAQTWQSATASMQAVSIGLLRLALWLLAFSPYVGILVLCAWGGHRYWRRQRPSERAASESS